MPQRKATVAGRLRGHGLLRQCRGVPGISRRNRRTQLDTIGFPAGDSAGSHRIQTEDIGQPQCVEAPRLEIPGKSHKLRQSEAGIRCRPGK